MSSDVQASEQGEVAGDKVTGSPCHNCPEGTYRPGHTTKLLERGRTVLVVRAVPAQVCDLCGDALYAGATTRRLLRMLEAAVEAGTESEVRSYGPPAYAPSGA